MPCAVAPRLLLLLFSLLPAVRGNCPPPPKLKNAVFRNGDPGTSFPDGMKIFYKCLPNFYNIRGKVDVTQCLVNSWTHVEDFCEQSCPDTPVFTFAFPRKQDVKTYYVPADILTYNCRSAYERIPGINSVITCLQNYTWTELPKFCERKSCGNPGNPANGKAVAQTDFLYSSEVNFICNDGYRLIGSPSTQCKLNGKQVKWNQELPKCEQITCISPPDIANGTHNGSNGTFAYHSIITYKCEDGFSLTGEVSLRCITENQINGVWNGSAPECRRNLTPQGPTYNNSTPISRIEKKGSQIGIIAGVSTVSGVAAFASVVAAVRASRSVRQKRASSYNLNHGSKSMQLSATSHAEV
ncbi:complement decay-accelerating factor isoform X2 [Tiliqua scincoides]|uniref:complement decay-accelerating factor isoform X2 n=1 Tax=Tiliqua scincoides TaxID=71010 RepID=UPI003462B78F